jgi:hypothetical protein
MTNGILLRGSAIALGVAAFVSFSALSQAQADAAADTTSMNASTSDRLAPTPNWAEFPQARPRPVVSMAPAAAPNDSSTTASSTTASSSINAPAPGWAESHEGLAANDTSKDTTKAADASRESPVHYAIHHPRHYARWDGNPVRPIVGGVADLGSVALYPIYCFPSYGRCPVRVPYRF